MKVLVLVLCAGCSQLKSVGNAGKEILVDCTKAEAARAVTELGPLVETTLVRAVDAHGRVDWAPIKDAARQWTADIGGCLIADVVSRALRPPAPDPDAPQLSPVMFDVADLRAGFALFKAQTFGGVVFKTAGGPL